MPYKSIPARNANQRKNYEKHKLNNDCVTCGKYSSKFIRCEECRERRKKKRESKCVT